MVSGEVMGEEEVMEELLMNMRRFEKGDNQYECEMCMGGQGDNDLVSVTPHKLCTYPLQAALRPVQRPR